MCIEILFLFQSYARMSIGVVSAFSAMDFFIWWGQLNFSGASTKGHMLTKCYLSKFVVEVNSVEFLCSALGD